MRIVRVVPPGVSAALVTISLVVAAPARAQEPSTESTAVAAAPEAGVSPVLAVGAVAARPIVFSRPVPRPERPVPLLPLYGALATLQVLDIQSTRAALTAGTGHEANPVMQTVVGNTVMFVTVKASSTAIMIWASEKMWKNHRTTAVVFALVVNSATAAIVAHNYSVSR
jgi:Domain of unknown function (DUF5658)